MILYCNNCCIENRKGRNHESVHGPGAFYDLDPGDPPQSVANAQECLVATRLPNGLITFGRFRFTHEGPGQIGGQLVRVFYGHLIETNGPYPQTQAVNVEPTFFNVNGAFNRWKTLLK